jgi:hypothetical protein
MLLKLLIDLIAWNTLEEKRAQNNQAFQPSQFAAYDLTHRQFQPLPVCQDCRIVLRQVRRAPWPRLENSWQVNLKFEI